MRNPNPNSTSSKEESHSYASSSSLPRRTEAVDNDERQETGSTLSFPSSTANTLNPSIEDNQQTVVPCLLHLSFNQDHGCFAVGMDQGFRIYTCEPFEENARRIFDQGGGIGIVEMLFKCNIFALVGDGSDPQYPPNKLMIWDDHLNRFTADKSFQSKIRAVRLRRDRIIVVIEQKIFVHNFEDWKLLHEIETFVNPKGLCAVSQVSGSFVLVCPGLRKGEVRVEHYGSKRRTILILAHESRIACFALSQDGKLLATASTKGTLVRIYNTFDGALLQEVRRGADRADIYSLAFSPTAQWLAVSSDKGTVHIFSLKVNSGLPKTNKSHSASDPNLPTPLSTSSLSFIKGMLPKYFSSEWSVCQFRLHEGPQYIVAFGQKNTIVVVGMDGSFYRCQFDPKKGGEMTQLEFYNFLSPKETF